MSVAYRDMAVAVTASHRPYYLQQTLDSWAMADGLRSLGRFVIGLGQSDRRNMQLAVIAEQQHEFGRPIEIHPDSERAAAARGMHTALGELGHHMFADPAVKFTVFGEEDVTVSSDVLRYMRWAARRFAEDRQVIAVCAHSRGGQGWDAHEPAQDENADQAAVRLLPYFNAWCWGTWADRWSQVLEPTWDWDCDSGTATQSGYDWNMQLRVLPQVRSGKGWASQFEGGLCAVPDASRSQNIGEEEGWASNAWSFSFSQAQSFREERGQVTYRLVRR